MLFTVQGNLLMNPLAFLTAVVEVAAAAIAKLHLKDTE